MRVGLVERGLEAGAVVGLEQLVDAGALTFTFDGEALALDLYEKTFLREHVIIHGVAD